LQLPPKQIFENYSKGDLKGFKTDEKGMKVSLEKANEENNLSFGQNVINTDQSNSIYQSYGNYNTLSNINKISDSKILQSEYSAAYNINNSIVNNTMNNEVENLKADINRLNSQLKSIQGTNNELNMKIKEASDQLKTCNLKICF